MDFEKWCNAVSPKSRAGYAKQDDYEEAESIRIDFLRDSSKDFRDRRAKKIAIAARDHHLNQSDPFIYDQTYNQAYQGII